jgi:hypothetical protein
MGNSFAPTHIEPLYVPRIESKQLADLTCQNCGKCCIHPTIEEPLLGPRQRICLIATTPTETFCVDCRRCAGSSTVTITDVMPLLNEPMIKTECPCCHETLSLNDLLNHLQTCPTRGHSCNYCEESAPHLEETCSNKPTKCTICNVWFSKRDMQIHNEELHTPMRRCVMGQCESKGQCESNKLYTLDEYINHTIDEHSKPKYIPRYDIFDKSISDRVATKMCRTCRKVFPSRNELFHHLKAERHGREVFGV